MAKCKPLTDACNVCGKTREKPKSPGWTRTNAGVLLCNKCFDQTHVLRAIALPVMSVLNDGDDATAQFREAISEAFRMSTDMANWAIRQLLSVDVQRTPQMDRLPPLPPLDLYRLYNDRGCPLGVAFSQMRTVIFQAAKSHYLRHRSAALWAGTHSLPLFAYPAPFPIHNAGWMPEYWASGNAHHPVVRFRTHGTASGPQWVVRLGCGQPFFRQTTAFRQLVSGEAERGQMDLYTQTCGADDKGIVISHRHNSGGQRIPQRLMCKMVGYFPRTPRTPNENVMCLSTHPEAFWVAEIEGRIARPWTLNGDHVAMSMRMIRDWTQRHTDWLQRIGEDRKHEKRWPRRQRRQFADAYAKVCTKHHRRVKTWIDQMVAQAVGFAQRRRVSTVIYDDRNREWMPRFPWFAVGATLRQRLAREGIQLVTRESVGDAK